MLPIISLCRDAVELVGRRRNGYRFIISRFYCTIVISFSTRANSHISATRVAKRTTATKKALLLLSSSHCQGRQIRERERKKSWKQQQEIISHPLPASKLREKNSKKRKISSRLVVVVEKEACVVQNHFFCFVLPPSFLTSSSQVRGRGEIPVFRDAISQKQETPGGGGGSERTNSKRLAKNSNSLFLGIHVHVIAHIHQKLKCTYR